MSQIYDVFNGDADGICSLQQLRLADPIESILVTGVKRDIALLKQVNAKPGDHVNVLDVSLDKNREAVLALLDTGVNISYFDHHFPGDIPQHALFDCHIETLQDKGTSLLVNDFIKGQHLAWAVTGTFGDNFDQRAFDVAKTLGMPASQLDQLRKLGIYLNYNGYGATVDDLHFAPDTLFKKLHPYSNPLDFIADDQSYHLLESGYQEDMVKVKLVETSINTDSHALIILPAEAWARRVGGVYANELAHQFPDRAHALLTELPDCGYVVSVRAPLNNQQGADDLCRQFSTGGGRKAAAGINILSDGMLEDFEKAFLESFKH